jgi:hypothetical protein
MGHSARFAEIDSHHKLSPDCDCSDSTGYPIDLPFEPFDSGKQAVPCPPEQADTSKDPSDLCCVLTRRTE